MLPCQALPAAELQSLVDKNVAWHDANLSEFVEIWGNYVGQAAGSGASGGARAEGGPRSRTIRFQNRQHWHLAEI